MKLMATALHTGEGLRGLFNTVFWTAPFNWLQLVIGVKKTYPPSPVSSKADNSITETPFLSMEKVENNH